MSAYPRYRRRKSPSIALMLAIMAILLFLCAGAFTYAYAKETDAIAAMRSVVEVDTIYPGITVAGMDVGGMTYQQAYDIVMGYDADQLAKYTATFRVGEREWKENISVTSTAKEALDKAFLYARMGDLDARYDAIAALGQSPRDFPINYGVDAGRLPRLVNAIGDELDVAAVDAAVENFNFQQKTFEISEHSQGYKLDRESMLAQIQYSVENELFPIEVDGSLSTIEPAITKEQLGGRNRLLAAFSTNTTADADRNNNISLCAEAFNGSVVMPGDLFSLNEKTGRRSIDKGYKEAGVIQNGKLVPESGGGVCQVSTTLFNAVVRADLQIEERNNHSYPISYADPGQDAMIDYPSRDLQFINSTDSPIYIITHFKDRVLTVEIYGESTLDEEVTIALRTETDEEIPSGEIEYILDETLPEGKEQEDRKARIGYRMTTYKQYMQGGELIREEVLCKSYYRPYSAVIRKGVMKLPAVPANSDPADELPIIG